jgi:hypothetical protein
MVRPCAGEQLAVARRLQQGSARRNGWHSDTEKARRPGTVARFADSMVPANVASSACATLAAGADVIVNTDADYQYEASHIPAMTAPFLAGKPTW